MKIKWKSRTTRGIEYEVRVCLASLSHSHVSYCITTCALVSAVRCSFVNSHWNYSKINWNIFTNWIEKAQSEEKKKNTNEWKAKAVRGNRIRLMKNVPSKGPGGRRRKSGETGERKWTMETSAYKKRLSSIRDAVRVPIFIQQDLTFFSLFYVYTQIHRHTNTRLNKTSFSFTQGFSAMSIRPTVCVVHTVYSYSTLIAWVCWCECRQRIHFISISTMWKATEIREKDERKKHTQTEEMIKKKAKHLVFGLGYYREPNFDVKWRKRAGVVFAWLRFPFQQISPAQNVGLFLANRWWK